MKPSKELIARIRSGMASDQEMRDAGAEEVRAVKADSEVMHFRFSIKRAPKSLNEEARTVEHVASTEDQDRMGDRIAVRGWDLTDWQKNPVVLWDHQQGEPPIGRGLKARKANEDGVGPALLITTRFHDKEKYPFADLIYRMVADGDLSAGSVGFNPFQIDRPKSEEEAKELGVGEYGVYFRRQGLLEWTICTVPALAGALARTTAKRIEAKLDSLEKAGDYSWDVLNAVSRALKGEAPEQRVFAVPDMACVVVDELPAHATAAARAAQSGMVTTTEPVLRGATPDEVRAIFREERSAESGVDASLRAIRAVVRDELGAALAAFNKSNERPSPVAPVESPAGSGDGAEPEARAAQHPTETDLYESILTVLKPSAVQAK
jgi:hypothetical protein